MKLKEYIFKERKTDPLDKEWYYGISVMDNGSRVTSFHLRRFPSPIYLDDLVKMHKLMVKRFNFEIKL